MIKSKSFLYMTCLLKETRRPLSAKLEPIKMSYTSYESAADGERKPPIIIMHGLFGCKSNWNSLSKTLHNMTHRKVITVDARNHGDSPHTLEQSYQLMAEDVKFLMEDLGVEKASLIGHSMGGRTMMYLAVIYPELVESLIPVDISPINSKEVSDIQSVIDVLRGVNLEVNGPISKVRKLADEHMKSLIESPILRQFLLTNLIEVNQKYKWRINLESINVNFKNNIAVFPPIESTYDGPTYFIGGGDSVFLKPTDHEAIKQIFPSVKFDYIPGAGHWLHAEKPHEFLKLVTQFLATV
ncbi:protein ABHD11-like [Metopolophium dirhodum]|uniref:protein ABHD11-like n=1 Tax=Metopolophium dirhodum TaxID=44670 RepID=UPI00298F8BFD|nr:protein ABHD11-like [Metopolophium dirhodum]